MIKYFSYNSHDEFGQHITPANSSHDLTKTASMNYSSEITSIIDSMEKNPNMYYVVINALGSYEVWGINGNGDAFPRNGLKHLSLRSDLGTANDYGYKTFEYYAKLFKHHVNKPDSPSYGEVVFSHWNEEMDRVELIVGIDRIKGKDIVEALESGKPVAVSMGAKVRYDKCSICGNEAKTRSQYCKHAKGYMNKTIDIETAEQWSKELGKEILPGTKVHAINDYPKFFDISKVHIGADRTAFVLGKVASEGEGVTSLDYAEALGVMDDETFDKISEQAKLSEINKKIGTGSQNDIDGRMAEIEKSKIVAKAIKEKMSRVVENEPEIPESHINNISSIAPLKAILKGLLSVGIFPKPKEFQRMVLVRSGNKRLADELDSRGEIFNHKRCSREVPFENDGVDNYGIGRSMESMLPSRSFLPGMINPRVANITIMVKKSSQECTINNNLEQISAMYEGLKKYAGKLSTKQIAADAATNPWMQRVVGLAAYLKLVDILSNDEGTGISDMPASAFEGALQDTNFSGKMRFSKLAEQIVLPGAYISASIDGSNVYSSSSNMVNDWMSKQASIDDIAEQISNTLHFDM